MKKKLIKVLDKWFDGCGLLTISKITRLELYNMDLLDEYMNLSWSTWHKAPLIDKIEMYNEFQFDDHEYASQREMLLAMKQEVLTLN